MTPTTCPYCNAVLPTVDDGVRITCPRCGELVHIGNAPLQPVPSTLSPGAVRAEATRSRWPVVAAAAALLAVGAGIVIWQAGIKSRSTTPVNEQPHVVIRPVDVPGLGYLPASSDVVFTIQVPLLMEKLGPEAGDDPAKALTRFGLPEVVVDTVEKASGVGLKNVDQLVVGIGLQKASLPPQLVVVVVTRQPYDFPELLRKTKATTLKREGRTLHVAKATGVINVHWWSPNNRVLVATLQARDFDDVPAEPRVGVDHFRPEVGALIRDRVAEDACSWLVASSDKWTQHIGPYVLFGIGPFQGRNDLFAPAERLRSVVVAIPHPADRAVNLQMDLKTAAAAEELRTTLRERFEGEPIEVSGDEATCRIETAFDTSRISSILSRLLQEKK